MSTRFKGLTKIADAAIHLKYSQGLSSMEKKSYSLPEFGGDVWNGIKSTVQGVGNIFGVGDPRMVADTRKAAVRSVWGLSPLLRWTTGYDAREGYNNNELDNNKILAAANTLGQIGTGALVTAGAGAAAAKGIGAVGTKALAAAKNVGDASKVGKTLKTVGSSLEDASKAMSAATKNPYAFQKNTMVNGVKALADPGKSLVSKAGSGLMLGLNAVGSAAPIAGVVDGVKNGDIQQTLTSLSQVGTPFGGGFDPLYTLPYYTPGLGAPMYAVDALDGREYAADQLYKMQQGGTAGMNNKNIEAMRALNY